MNHLGTKLFFHPVEIYYVSHMGEAAYPPWHRSVQKRGEKLRTGA